MGIPTTCPHCGETSRIKEKYAGRRGNCPLCGGRLRVPRLDGDDSGSKRSSRRHRSEDSRRERSSRRRSESRRERDSDREERHRDRRRSRSKKRRRSRDAAPADEFASLMSSAREQEAQAITTVRIPTRRTSDERMHPGLIVLLAVVATTVVLGLLAIMISVSHDATKHVADVAQEMIDGPEPRIEDYPPNEVPPHVLREISDRRRREAEARSAQHAQEMAKAAEAKKHAPVQSLEDMVARVEGGIVLLVSFHKDVPYAQGSGFVVSDDGLVMTNLHVVAGADRVEAIFHKGSEHHVNGFIDASADSDVAVLSLQDFPPDTAVLEFTSRVPPKGADVYAIGHPHGHAFSVTRGIVSNVFYTHELPEESRTFLRTFMNGEELRWVQHDAAISSGNSGGPLLDAHGQVIGINTWVNQKTNLGYALVHESLYVRPSRSRGKKTRPLSELPHSLSELPDSRRFAKLLEEVEASTRGFRSRERRVDHEPFMASLQQVSLVIMLFQQVRPRLVDIRQSTNQREMEWGFIKTSVDTLVDNVGRHWLEHIDAAQFNTKTIGWFKEGEPTCLIGEIVELRTIDQEDSSYQAAVIKCPGVDRPLIAPWHKWTHYADTWLAFDDDPVGDECVVLTIDDPLSELFGSGDESKDQISLFNVLLVPRERPAKQSKPKQSRGE